MALDFSIPGTDISFSLDLPNPAEYASGLLDGLKDFVSGIFGGIGDFFMNAINSVVSGIGNAMSGIKDGFLSKVKSGLTQLALLIKNTFKKVF